MRNEILDADLFEYFESSSVCIIGLGYVGLPLAVEFGSKRLTIGFDINRQRIERLSAGIDDTMECKEEQIENAQHLSFTYDKEDISDCKIYIVTVPTPINEAKKPHLRPLIDACELIGSVLKVGDCVIFESTVYPGATEEVCIPVLENKSNLRLNEQFYCGYSPERINPGDKINTLTKITKIVSGSDPKVARKISQLYESIIPAGVWLAPTIKVAEAAKVIENAQRDLNIAFVNELSLIFELIGIDTLDVLEAAGSKWNFIPFKPGLVGGHCISVDPYYLTYKAEQLGYDPEVILAGRRINEKMAKHAAIRLVKKLVKNGVDLSSCKIALLGVTFKENCPDIRNTRIVDMLDELLDWTSDIVVCDPWADKQLVKSQYNIDLVDFKEIKNVDAVIVAVGHNEFRTLLPSELRKLFGKNIPILADLKGLYNRENLIELGFDVFRL